MISVIFEKYKFMYIVLGFSIFFIGILVGIILSRRKISQVRKDAVKRSRSVLGGLMAEQVAPLLPNFPCNPSDCRFVGKPIDFVAFPNLSKSGECEEILFIEVKTGSSALSAREKSIRKCVAEKKVRYVEYRLESL